MSQRLQSVVFFPYLNNIYSIAFLYREIFADIVVISFPHERADLRADVLLLDWNRPQTL